MLSNSFSDFISDMEVTDHTDTMITLTIISITPIDNIENKIESLHLQECPLKIRSLWKLVILLEPSFF